jgi:UDP-N-acetylmuramate dehydrogenase
VAGAVTAPSDLDDLAAKLAARLPNRVQRNVPSANLTTYRCGGPIAVVVRAEQEQDLYALADLLPGPDVPVLVIGRGSNLLFADHGFAGVGVALAGEFEQLDIGPVGDRAAEAVHVRAGGGVPLPVLARRTAAAGVAGLEFFVGIPGSVGGAVRMNAGGHGAQTADVIVGARVFDLDEARARDLRPVQLGLGYRRSAITARVIVVAATFAGRPDEPVAVAARIDEIVRWRREHQPGGQNAGSVFTNPDGDSAGRLIDAAGCKGARVGGAVVSEKHANFFVAEPGARAADVHELIEHVRGRVHEATGVWLVPELHLIGFEPLSDARTDAEAS